MDAGLRLAARALSMFDPLAALREVALRNDPPALAMRGIAMAQIGDFTVARKLLRRAARAFGEAHPVARARCVAAEAEVALACRDLGPAADALEEAADALEANGDVENALFTRLQIARFLVLVGSIRQASAALSSIDLRGASPRHHALTELIKAEIALRSVRPADARHALLRARDAARNAAIVSLIAEVDRAISDLDAPVARLSASGSERPVLLDEVESMVRSGALVVDACRRQIRKGRVTVSLVHRPVLLSLAAALGEAAPGEATREALILRAFDGRRVNESLRARLRVEIGRLRREMAEIAEVRATKRGFTLTPRRGEKVVVLLPPTPGEASALLALLGGGEPWSTSGLAAALGNSQRAVQRALSGLEAEGRVRAIGNGRARRWLAPPPAGFATILLLAAREPIG